MLSARRWIVKAASGNCPASPLIFGECTVEHGGDPMRHNGVAVNGPVHLRTRSGFPRVNKGAKPIDAIYARLAFRAGQCFPLHKRFIVIPL
jgi:hypothetical protein